MKREVVWEGKIKLVNIWEEDEERFSMETDLNLDKLEKILKMGDRRLTKSIVLNLIASLELLKLDLVALHDKLEAE